MRRAGQQGFTLIELVVAIAILAFISLGAYQFLSSTSLVARGLQEREQKLLALARMQGVLANDLSQWVDRPIRDELGDPRPAFLLDSAGNLEFTRRGLANPLDRNRSDLLRVRYEVRGDRLWRLSWSTLDRLPGMLPLATPIGPRGVSLTWRAQAGPGSPVQLVWPPISSGATALSGAVLNAGAPEILDLSLRVAPWGELRRVYGLPGHDVE